MAARHYRRIPNSKNSSETVAGRLQMPRGRSTSEGFAAITGRSWNLFRKDPAPGSCVRHAMIHAQEMINRNIPISLKGDLVQALGAISTS
jgi:hypothetical protein